MKHIAFMGFLAFAWIQSLFAATQIRDYDDARHDRLYSGTDKAFIGADYDWSGVGFIDANTNDGRLWATLISDRYFLSAEHWHPGTNQTVKFFEGNDTVGTSRSYDVAGGERIGETDLWVGKLATVADVSLRRYPVFDLDQDDDYVGRVLHTYGQVHRVARNVADSVKTYEEDESAAQTLWFDYDNDDSPSVGGDECYLNIYDSGAPSFSVYDGELALVGIHWSVTGPGIGTPTDPKVPLLL